MKKTVLIAEDVMINRRVLSKILSDEYDILQAENGKQAIEILEQTGGAVAAIILDLQMPVMTGFEVMDVMHTSEVWGNIPIIVTTGNDDRESELRALKCGAWDFVAKPYDADILKFRLNNAIERSKLNLLEQLKRQAEIDSLTGLYNERKFYQMTQQMLDSHPDDKFVIIRFDVDRFKQFNSFFGLDEGNNFLCYIAGLMKAVAPKFSECVYGRMEADVFAICVSYEDLDHIMHSIEIARERIRAYSNKFDIVTVYGLYEVTDRTISVNQMLDRATLAARTCKGKYIKTVAIYTDAMGRAVEQEQEIINEMSAALQQEQFCVYYQPKYNITINRPSGAEALVRWKHPVKGMISPGVFIPVFEKNGFVARVDYFVWEKTCQYLRKWCDMGLNPDPVSVNISRVNLSNPQIVEMITELVNKYDLPARLLQLEITESAYMDNPEIMNHVVDHFHENGFTILMDDFGSGYSSLNTLKEIAVDILKIDMKFLPNGNGGTKSEKILASMIRMADWVGMPVICEGVETAEQRDFLHSVGCMFVQGYFYGRPMPVDEYEKLISHHGDSAASALSSSLQNGDLNALLSADKNTETLLRSIDIPVVIYAYDKGRYDRVRANQCFFNTFGYTSENHQQIERISPNEGEKVNNAFNRVVATQGSSECETLFIMGDGSAHWYRVKLRYIMPGHSGHIICAVYSEITDAKRVESEMTRIVGILNQSAAIAKKTMLVVDDSDVSRALLQTMFSQEYHILEASNGREALDLLNVNVDEISIILLDMIMPVMDGAEFLALKSRMETATRIPVIVISSENSEKIQVNMLRLGVNDYVTKPFVPELVYQRVRNVLEYQSRFEELVKEYRQVLSINPDIGGRLVDTYVNVEETCSLISFMKPIFDVVRIVDPQDMSVISIDENYNIHAEPYTCFKVWKKDKRCTNCTSLCAVQGNCQLTKYEFIENNIFYVVSRPIIIVPKGEKPKRVVLEIVSHVSDSVLANEINGVPMGEIMENTRRQIYCDPLTEAYNRRYLYEMLFTHKGVEVVNPRVAFIMIDLNNFKAINDTYGHAEGDRVLVETVKALSTQIRHADSVVRYGGDEFLITLTNCDSSYIEEKIASLKDAVGGVYVNNDMSMPLKASFGYAYTDDFNGTKAQLEELVRRADEMMYCDKKSNNLG